MCDTFNCGFSRVAVKLSCLHADGRIDCDMQSRWERYNAFFGEQNAQHEVSLKTFRKRVKPILESFRSWKASNVNDKEDYTKYFSSAKWKSLPKIQKLQHSGRDCRACMVHHQVMHSTFPLPRMRKSGAIGGPVKVSKSVASQLSTRQKAVKPTKKALVEATKEIYNNINKPFQEIYGINFSQAQTNVDELKLQIKKSKNQMKKERRAIRREDKVQVSKMMADTEVEAVLSTRQSLSQRNKKRKLQFFETKDEAVVRSKLRKELEESGERVRKKHSPNAESLMFDKEGVLKEVTEMSEGDTINYSELSRKYGLHEQTKVGGMVVKEFLLNQNVDLSKFSRKHRTPKRAPRRRLNRLPGGEITVPVPPTNMEVSEGIKVKIQQGEYCIGELIVPRTYKKILVDQRTGLLKEGTFTVSGRKIPLSEIRQRELTRLEEAGVVRGYSDHYYANMTDEEVHKRLLEINNESLTKLNISAETLRAKLKQIERTRHLKQWGDNSTVLNHGHFLMMVSSIYDNAFFYTSKELELQGRPGVNVQQIVERPHIYILGRCSSSEIEQIGYVATRGECLRELRMKVKLKSGIEISDIMRLFTGDGPEQDTECGEQQGGHAGCVSCSGDSRKYRNILYSYSLPVLTLNDRTNLVRRSPAGRHIRNGGLKPFVNLTIDQLKAECHARDLDDEGTRKDLEAKIKKSLGGIQRVPALLLYPHGTTLEELHLENYEISPTEPLHDVKEHIRNLLNELPFHLTKEEKEEFTKMKDILFNSKDKLRGSDFRSALIIISQHMRGKCNLNVQHILDTMTDITHIAYDNAEHRSPRQVLRLHNQSFLHFMRCKILIGNLPKHHTYRKMYGRYWHSLTTHAPILYRIIALSSVHTEEEERTFSAINSIASGTTSRRPGEIITPTLVRIQAETRQREKEQNGGGSWIDQNSKVSQLSSILPNFPNSIIPNGFLIKYPAEYQCHLERISDFLLPGEGVWWRRDLRGVEFFDGADDQLNCRPEGPFLHHFRYSNLKMEENYLAESWRSCLRENVTIPHTVISCRNEADTEDIDFQTGYFQHGDDSNEEDEFPSDTVKEDQERNESGNESDEEDETEIEIGFYCEKNDLDLVVSDTEEDHPSNPSSITKISVATTSVTTEQHAKHISSSESTCRLGSTENAPNPLSASATDKVTCRKHPSHRNEDNSRMKTELANNILHIIPEERDLVTKLDKARIKWKSLHNNDNSEIARKAANDDYLKILALVQTKVLAQHDPLKTQLRKWEENFFFENMHREPQREDIQNCPEAYSLYKRLKLCKQLLSHWKISLHLD